MINPGFLIKQDFISEKNQNEANELNKEFDFLGERLARKGINITDIVQKVKKFYIAIPSWGTAAGGTRFATYHFPGEPKNIYEKLSDCSTINKLTGINNKVSLHIPWDKAENVKDLLDFSSEINIGFDAVNSNTFQDQRDQKLSYKYGSLSHTDPKIRKQAIDHNIECIDFGKKIGSKALSVWIGDGGNFPGQQHFSRTFERYIESLKEVYKSLPDDWKMFIEHKLFEPSFYSTVLNDWGSSYIAAKAIGEKVMCLVDLGHHAPNVNIEMIVARLIQLGKLAGFHFNDSKYGDDDLDSGSINPYQLFLVFNELVDAEYNNIPGFAPCYMIDQSHCITDPIESLISSVEEIQKAYIKSLLVDRNLLYRYQDENDPIMALRTLKAGYDIDVSPIIKKAREEGNGAIEPIKVYRESKYREQKAKERN